MKADRQAKTSNSLVKLKSWWDRRNPWQPKPKVKMPSKEPMASKSADDLRAQAAKKKYAEDRGLDPITLKPRRS